MRLVFAEPAARDLAGIIDYIAIDSPAGAEAVYRMIVATTRRLMDFPEVGRPGRLPHTRELPMASLPYLIVYRVEVEVVTILAVFHGARDIAQALAERHKDIRP
jgi:toxin ParE1/3/4